MYFILLIHNHGNENIVTRINHRFHCEYISCITVNSFLYTVICVTHHCGAVIMVLNGATMVKPIILW